MDDDKIRGMACIVHRKCVLRRKLKSQNFRYTGGMNINHGTAPSLSVCFAACPGFFGGDREDLHGGLWVKYCIWGHVCVFLLWLLLL